MLRYLAVAAAYSWAMLKFAGAVLVATLINAVINAFGVWIILEQFDYSLSGFWAYVIVGFGLAIIMTPMSDSDK
jgi:hypothetical protein